MFDVSAEAYAAFMGRFSAPLAVRFADAAGVAAGQTALDVGCGPGALTEVLVARLGAERVCAADPSEPFVEAVRRRCPGVDVRRAGAETLPFEDGRFDRTLAQLVVAFMTDPVAGLREMARVTRPGGVVAANMWDLAGGTGPLALFYAGAHAADPDAPDETRLPGGRRGHLEELFAAAGLTPADSGVLTVEVRHGSFEDWWEPFTYGVGPAGSYLAALPEPRRVAVRERCRELAPDGPFSTSASAWLVGATVPGG